MYKEQPSERSILTGMILSILLYFNGIGLLTRHYGLGFILGNILGIIWIIGFLYYFSGISRLLSNITYPLILLIFINTKYKGIFKNYSLLKSEMNISRYSLILISIVFLSTHFSLLYAQLQNNPELFATIRYKHIGDWKVDETLYEFDAEGPFDLNGSSAYLHKILIRNNLDRIMVYWNNDTTHWQMASVDTILKYKPS